MRVARLRRTWSRLLRRPRARDANDEPLQYERLIREVEAGLEDIAFEEVTIEDRATFVEHAVVWQVRRALRTCQFDLALRLARFGVHRIAQLREVDPAGVLMPRRRLRLVRGGRTQDPDRCAAE